MRFIKDYEILCKLYKGPNSNVYRVSKDDKEFVIKESFDNIILNEIDVISRIYHPNVIKYIEFFEDDTVDNKNKKSFYIVFPKATTNLRKYIETKKLDEKSKTIIIYEIVSGLDAIHKSGAYHCDVKPENILMFKNKAVLADLGLALYFTVAIKKAPCVTPYLASPEWLMNNPNTSSNYKYFNTILKKYLPSIGKDYDYLSVEMWSLGVTIAYILTGKYIFTPKAENWFYDIVINLQNYSKDPIKFLKNSGIDDKWIPLMMRFFEINYKKRIKTIKEILSFPIFKNIGLDKPVLGKVVNEIPFNITCNDDVKIYIKYIMSLTKYFNLLVITFINACYLFYQSYDYIIPIYNKKEDKMFLTITCFFVSAYINEDTILSYNKLKIYIPEFNISKFEEKFKLFQSYLLKSLKGMLYSLNIYHYAFSKKSLKDMIPLMFDCEKFKTLNIKQYAIDLEKKETKGERLNRESKIVKFNDLNIEI